MFVTIVDFIVFSIFAALIVTAYILIRAALRERLINLLIMHAAYTLTGRNELQYNGMMIVEEDNVVRSPRPSDFDQADIPDIVRENHHAGNVLSWGWPVTWTLTQYRIKKTLELAQLTLDMRNEWAAEHTDDTGSTEPSTALVPLDASDEETSVIPVESADDTSAVPAVIEEPDNTTVSPAYQETEPLDAVAVPSPVSALPLMGESTDTRPEESDHVSIDQTDYRPGSHHLGSSENAEEVYETATEINSTRPLPVVDLDATQVMDFTEVSIPPSDDMTEVMPIVYDTTPEHDAEVSDEPVAAPDSATSPGSGPDETKPPADSVATDTVIIDRETMNAALEGDRAVQRQIAERAADIEAQLSAQEEAARVEREERERVQREQEAAEHAAREREENERAAREAQEKAAARQAIEDRRTRLEAALEQSRHQGFLK